MKTTKPISALLTTALLLALTGFIPASAQEQPILLLEDALRHVYTDSPVLQAARMELRATQELYPQALANWRPTLEAQGSIYNTAIDSSNFSRGDGATTKDFTLNLEQPLYRGGRTVAQSAQAEALIMAARAELAGLEQGSRMAAR